MTVKFRPYYVLNGGVDGALDKELLADLGDGDTSFVSINGTLHVHRFDITATDAEQLPSFIRPDDFVSAGVHVLQGIRVADMQADNILIDGNTISSADVNGDIILTPNGTGKVGIKTATPSGTAHIKSGASGFAGSYHTSFDDLIIENSSDAGIVLSTPNDSNGFYAFADEDFNYVAALFYDHFNDRLTLYSAGAGAMLNIISSGVGIGTTILDGSAVGVIGIGNGTAPAAITANVSYLWSQDFAAGDARLYVMGETSTDTVIIGNGDIIANSILAGAGVSGVLTLGAVGGTNNENLTFDFESTANQVIVGTGTSVSTLAIPFPIKLRTYHIEMTSDNTHFAQGEFNDVRFLYDSDFTRDSWQFGVSAGSNSQSGYLSLMEAGDLQNANREPAAFSVDPVFRIYSSDATEALDYLESYHNQTDPVIDWGNGDLQLLGGNVVITGDFNPEADGTRDLGTQTTAQWANVWSDLINGADYSYLNKWRTLELEKYKGYPVGWAIGNKHFKDGEITKTVKGKPVFAIADDFIEFKGRRITEKMLDKLLVILK